MLCYVMYRWSVDSPPMSGVVLLFSKWFSFLFVY